MGTEAMYWLLLIYDFKHFKKMFGYFGYPGNVRTPMVFIANILFKLKHEWNLVIWTRSEGWIWKKQPEWKAERSYDNDTDDLPF